MYTGVSWGDATFVQKVENSRASLISIKSSDTTVEKLRLDENSAEVMAVPARQIQDQAATSMITP